ncbi:hypothetical protein PMAYCL1PPCAC_28674, partial [Pristionchus mayeri]
FSALGGMNTQWDQYTMDIRLKEPFEEAEEHRVLGKFSTCTPDGIHALTIVDDNYCFNIIFINMLTRCEVNRLVLQRSFEMRHIDSVDSKTIVYVGNFTRNIPGRIRCAEPHVLARVITSEDGFRSIKEDDVIFTIAPSKIKRYPDFCVSVGNGFVYAMRDFGDHYKTGTPIELFYVLYPGLLHSAASEAEEKSYAATPIGSILAMGEARFFPIPYDDSSFVVLAGDHGKNRIDIYSIQSKGILRSIPVIWPLPITFPPPNVHFIPGSGMVLLQSMTGAKLMLNLRNGNVEMLTSFIAPSGQMLNLDKHIRDMSRIEIETAGYEMTRDGDSFYVSSDDEESPVDDLIFFTPGSTTVDGAFVGWFATKLMENYEEDCMRLKLLRLPIDKVNSLTTVALDAVCKMLSKEIRLAITEEVNPRNAAQFVRVIVRKMESSLRKKGTNDEQSYLKRRKCAEDETD